MTILLFDSGVGGLTVFREARMLLPEYKFVYVGDDAGFPYGEWDEQALTDHIVALFSALMTRFCPTLAIIACNTASTLIMPALRERFAIPFVGIVPAIKPAAERTYSGLFSVLATPGTVKRPYVSKLIHDFASGKNVTLVGATGLARLAEQHVQGKAIDVERLREEISPCFVQNNTGRTDIITLGCTHYPFLVNEMRKIAPWPVDWLDPAEAVARHTRAVLHATVPGPSTGPSTGHSENGVALMTSGCVSITTARLMQSFGLRLHDDIVLL